VMENSLSSLLNSNCSPSLDTGISVSSDGEQFEFKRELTFFVCSLLAGPSFACNMQNSKQNFFKQHFWQNGVKRDTHLLTVSLIDSFCVPKLLYG